MTFGFNISGHRQQRRNAFAIYAGYARSRTFSATPWTPNFATINGAAVSSQAGFTTATLAWNRMCCTTIVRL